MRRLLVAIALAALFASAYARPEWRLGPSGYGPVRIGMTQVEAENALGTKLETIEGQPLGEGCDYLFATSDHSGLSFLTEAGRITNAGTGTRGVASRSGIRVGDPSSKVRSIYGKRLSISKGYYGGFDYFVWERGKMSGIRYVIEEDHVIAIQAGDSTIQYVEGCE